MFLFSLKKSFFDAWDHFLAILLSNFTVMIIAGAVFWPVSILVGSGNPGGLLIIAAGIPVIAFVVGVISRLTSSMADYRGAAWSDIGAAIRETWKASLLLGIFIVVFFGLSAFGISYYRQLNGFLGTAAAALLFWISFGVYLASIWFFPVRNSLSGGIFKSAKKCGIIMLDNIGISLFVGLVMIPLQILLWVLTAFAAFGPAGIQIYVNGVLRLLMLKYDWLEDHPDSGKRDVPWFELLIDEKEKVGKRTIRGMIFPWKE